MLLLCQGNTPMPPPPPSSQSLSEPASQLTSLEKESFCAGDCTAVRPPQLSYAPSMLSGTNRWNSAVFDDAFKRFHGPKRNKTYFCQGKKKQTKKTAHEQIIAISVGFFFLSLSLDSSAVASSVASIYSWPGQPAPREPQAALRELSRDTRQKCSAGAVIHSPVS